MFGQRPKPLLSRRLLLKGLGSIAIGLPFLEEFSPRAHASEGEDVPCRLFTLSFGLGIEEAMQLEQFDGPLETLQPFAEHAAFFTNVDAGPLASSGTPHFTTGAATFTGVPQQPEANDYHAGGPSMEQVMKRALHPEGVPNVSLPELSVGLWSRTGAVSQFTRQWNTDGSPGMRPERRPSAIFDALFGSFEPPSPDGPTPEQLRRNHVNRSVLDSVMGQYESLMGPNSPLGVASKARVDNHLAAIRDVELQLAPPDDGGITLDCEVPDAAEFNDPDGYPFYDAAEGATGTGAPIVDWEVADQVMQRIGRLMALAAACDALRFGSLICVGAGGHVRLDGTYEALGESIDFPATFGNGTPHDRIFHDYNREAIRLYQHFAIRQLSHMLGAMHDITEVNGRSVLENSLLLMGTEYGENHDASHAFHAVIGGGDRFNPGWYDQPLLPSDVYHEALAAYGVDSEIPDRWPDFTPTEITGFRNA